MVTFEDPEHSGTATSILLEESANQHETTNGDNYVDEKALPTWLRHSQEPMRAILVVLCVMAAIGGCLTTIDSSSSMKQNAESVQRQQEAVRLLLESEDKVHQHYQPCELPRYETDKFKLHCAPSLIIAGAMKCGTNEVGSILMSHPHLVAKTCSGTECHVEHVSKKFQGQTFENQEVNLWESQPWKLRKEEGYDEYFARFPFTDGIHNSTIDKSPAFMVVPKLPEVVHRLMPETRLVFTVCDPAERLVSEYFHLHKEEKIAKFEQGFVENGVTPPADFDDFVSVIAQKHPDCLKGGNCLALQREYLKDGLYIEHLKQWWQYFDKSSTLVLNMVDSREVNTRKLLEFANLSFEDYPWDTVLTKPIAYQNVRTAGYTSREQGWTDYPESMKYLSDVYAGLNRELASALGEDFPLEWKSSTVGDDS